MTNKRIFFSVGEPSGDLHASNLILDLKKQFEERQDCDQGTNLPSTNDSASIDFTGFGGPKMATVGCELLEDLTQHAVMFLSGVISKYAKFRRLLKDADKVFRTKPIDLVVLIDYSGFNWHVAKAAKKHGIPVVFYGIPQMWAWAPWRVRKMRRNVNLGICKLPFEKKWLEDRNCEAEYVGHPFFDEMDRQVIDQDYVSEFRTKNLTLNDASADSSSVSSADSFDEEAGGEIGIDRTQGSKQSLVKNSIQSTIQSSIHSSKQKDLVTILPGSRVQEIKNCLPIFLKTAEKIKKQRPDTEFVVSCLNDDQKKLALEIQTTENVGIDIRIEGGKTPELVHLAKCCVACSGSVSLELMHREKPTVIYYRLPKLFFAMQKLFLRIKYITLVNLLWSKSIKRNGMSVYDPDSSSAEQLPFPEYLSTVDKSTEIAGQIVSLLNDPTVYEERKSMLRSLKQQYGAAGASHRAATVIMDRFLNPRANDTTRTSDTNTESDASSGSRSGFISEVA